MTVNAEDIEIIPVNDPGTWYAFKFFENYGYSADIQTTEEQIYTTSGTTTLTGNFTFTGTFTGLFDATVELAVDTLIGTELADVDNILSGYTHYYLDKDQVKLKIHPTDNATQQNNGFSFGCVYNAQSTSTSSEMICTPTSGLAQTIILPDQEITIDSIDTLFNSVTNYSIALTLRNEGTIVGNIEGTLSGSIGGSGTVSLSGVYDETTTTTNKQSYKFTMPYMSKSSDLWKPADYNGDAVIHGNGSTDNPFIIAFLSSQNFVQYMKLYNWKNNTELPTNTYTRNSKYVTSSNNWQLDYIEYYGSAFTYLNVTRGVYGATKIYPIYIGFKNDMSDNLYRFIYGSDRTIEKIGDQMAADQQHHDEMMDTSDSEHIASDGNALIESADDKFGDLFFPLQHAIETANDLSHVQATGLIRLPAIFSDGKYWYLDLTQIEQKLPEAWTFIRSLCQLAVSMYLILGLYHLFFGKGDETNDS